MNIIIVLNYIDQELMINMYNISSHILQCILFRPKFVIKTDYTRVISRKHVMQY